MPGTPLAASWRQSQPTSTESSSREKTLDVLQPDLAIDWAYTSAEGTPPIYTLHARLANFGLSSSGDPFTLTLRAGHPLTGPVVTTIPFSGMPAPATSFTVTHPLTDTSLLRGADWLYVKIDPVSTSADANPQNDFARLRPDLLADLTLSTYEQNQRGAIGLSIVNRGFLTATQVLIEARLGGLQGDSVYSTTIDSLAPGKIMTLSLPPQAGGSRLFIQADPHNTIPERDKGNNLAVWIMRPAAQYWRMGLPLLWR
jgi:hypothetical protein